MADHNKTVWGEEQKLHHLVFPSNHCDFNVTSCIIYNMFDREVFKIILNLSYFKVLLKVLQINYVNGTRNVILPLMICSSFP